MSLSIRTLVSNDRNIVVGILCGTPEFEPAEIPVAEEVLDAYLASPGGGYQALVAEEDGAVLGYICFGTIPLTAAAWDIYWLAVQREQRGRGVGRTLLAEAEGQMKRAGGYLVLIETSSKPNYLPTRRFYRKNGYHETSCIWDFYGIGDHRVTFAKKL
ncbi:MAG: GNAT family N-acetyltransferase [Dehalococcoidia bacterium]|nr:GNAT family N-acetyltransferase [Dehalococcoidia bacterium]